MTVEITVANDVSIGQGPDSDIRYGVSDGTRFFRFHKTDKGNHGDHSPCYGMEGVSGSTLTPTRYEPNKPKPSDSFYPGQFVFTLKLDERRGSCYTAHDGVASINLLSANEIQEMSALNFFFFATFVNLRGNVRVRLATERNYLPPKFNLQLLATACESVWPGFYGQKQDD